jgi:mRNA-degrading endonuclease RelE of RelBE toxin-antitoxin system
VRLVLEKAARKGLDRMPGKAAAAMLERLERIAADPLSHHANVEPLKGERHAYRLRQGGWRAIYRLSRENDELRVVLVEVRGQAYR